MSKKYLDYNGLLYFWGKIKTHIYDHVYPIGSFYQTMLPPSAPSGETPVLGVNYFDPAEAWGGTWTQIHGRFLVAEGDNGGTGEEVMGLSAGDTGGYRHAQLLSHTHPVDITSKGMSANSSHSHGPGGESSTHFMYRNSNSGTQTRSAVGTSGSAYTWRGTTAGGFASSTTTESKSLAHTHEVEGTTGSAGVTPSIGYNDLNLPPYLAVYMWKRTA